MKMNRVFFIIVVILILGLSCKAQERNDSVFRVALNKTSLYMLQKENRNVRRFLRGASNYVSGYDGKMVTKEIPIYSIYAKKTKKNPMDISIDSLLNYLNADRIYLTDVLVSQNGVWTKVGREYANHPGRVIAQVDKEFVKLYEQFQPDMVLNLFGFPQFLVLLKDGKIYYYDYDIVNNVRAYKQCDIRDFFPKKDLVWSSCLIMYKPEKLYCAY